MNSKHASQSGHSAAVTGADSSLASEPMARLAALLEKDEAELDLGEAALTIAAAHYPHLDMNLYRERLDAMTVEARKRIGRLRRLERVVAALRAYLFEECGFHGNIEDYYAPVNSFLHEVLDNRSGLPITLSVLILTLAQRLGLPASGVGMPMHYLVKFVGTQEEILVDPFYGGEVLTPEGCRARLERIVGKPVAFHASYLEAVSKRQTLYRMLNNLKMVYLHRKEPERAGLVVEQMLTVRPDLTDNIRDRGLLCLHERAYTKAILWLSRYLEEVSDAPDRGKIEEAIRQAQERRARLN